MLPRGFLAIQISRQYGSISSVQNAFAIMLMLQCNQACNTDHIRWYDKGSILDIATTTFV